MLGSKFFVIGLMLISFNTFASETQVNKSERKPAQANQVIKELAPSTNQYCCEVCSAGKACGNSCISRNKSCHQPPGCACNG